jgi:5'-deoxynucleotidase YfbR-like HD superfamily hydrolase
MSYVSKAGDLRVPGIMTCISGKKIDLQNCTADDIDITDIAWGLGRTLRYAGHIREDYTVAHHSIVMSYSVPEEFALEALLHDAAEGYMGDIIWPLKVLFPEISEFENVLLTKIMKKFEVPTACYREEAIGYDEVYVMSKVVKDMDVSMMQHECFDQGIRPGIFNQDIENSWLIAANQHAQFWYASQYAFLERFDELTGSKTCDLGELTKVWFPDEAKREKSRAEEGAAKALDQFINMLEKEDA